MRLRSIVVAVVVMGLAAAIGFNLGRRSTALSTSQLDRTEVMELLYRHQIYIDLRDYEGYASLYAESGTYESPFASARGRQELFAMTKRLHEAGFTQDKRHFAGPSMIDIEGSRATAISYWWVADTSSLKVFATGTYQDELRKIDGKWQILHRIQTLDSGPGPEGGS